MIITYGQIVNNKLVLASEENTYRYNQDETNSLAKQEGFYPVNSHVSIKDGYKIEGYKLENDIIIPNVVKDIYSDEWATYIDKRAREYPPLEDQLDMIYWDKINGTDIWEQTITAIKEKYPKE